VAKVSFRPRAGQKKRRLGPWPDANNGRKQQFAILALTGLALLGLVALVVSSAAADTGELAAGTEHPTPQQIEAVLNGEGPASQEPEPTDEGAAEEMPHTDLGRSEAADLLTAVFSPEITDAAGPFSDLEVDHYHGNHVAILQSGSTLAGPDKGRQLGLIESALPLRTEEPDGTYSPVDLTLERSEGELKSANPLVEVRLPAELGEGISIPEAGVKISVAGVHSEREASNLEGDAAFYPNVSADTDLTVVPTPEGVETFAQLRSADSPTQQTFDLTLPSGANLRRDSEGGIEIVSEDGRELLSASSPTAIDATGASIPVSLEMTDRSVTLSVHPPKDATFPILVDPIWQKFTWGQAGGPQPDYSGWTAWTNSPLFQVAENDWCSACNDIVWGIELNSFPGATEPWSRAVWDYHVPRWFEDQAKGLLPTSYINYAMFGRVGYDIGWEQNNHSITYDPIFEYYLWSDENGFVAIGKRLGTEGNLMDPGYQYILQNPNANEDAKQAEVELVTTQPYSQWRHAYVGDAWVELTDNDYPGFGELANPAGWVNNSPTAAIPFKVTDTGLGVYELQAVEATSTGTQVVPTLQGCTGGAGSPCPRTWSSSGGGTLKYNPAVLPQGEDTVALDASDPIGHFESQKGSQSVKIKVDHTAPKLAVAGSVMEQSTLGTGKPSYTVKYNVTDGTHAAAEAQTPIGGTAAGTGTTQFNGPRGVAADKQGHVWVVDRGNNRVMEYDEAGQFIRQIGEAGTGNGKFSEPYGVTVTPEGNIWVTDTGNHRVQEFNSTGQYLQQFGESYHGGDKGPEIFLEPKGIVSAPGGMLWVSDQAGERIAEFREQPTQNAPRFVQEAAGVAMKKPVGLADDGHGHLLAAVVECNCVRSFNESNGKFLMQFGSTGTGNGQFNVPTNIAVAPSGNLLVTDKENNRVEQFQPNGAYVRSFGSSGTGSSNFSLEQGIAFIKGNTVFVADAGNNRVSRWSNADYDPQSGVRYVLIQVDGKAQELAHESCPRDCELSGSWTLEARNYSDGPHTVEVSASDGVELATTVKIPIEIKADHTGPTVALSGSMTEQESLGTTRPRYKLKLRTSDGALGEATAAEGGPTAAYAFDEGSGTAAKDAAGGHEGTATAPTWVEGKYGKALSFNGTSSCVTVPNSADLQLSGAFSLEAWIKPTNNTQWAPLIFKEAENFYGYSLFFGAFEAGHLQGYIANESWQYTEVESPEKLTANTWAHVAMTSDGTTLKLYVNGKQIDSAPARAAMESKGPLQIGCAKNFGEYFSGTIDNVRLYNRALSAAEVEANKGVAVVPSTAPMQSGIAKTEIKLDGSIVDSSSTGCTSENCSVAREWTLNAAGKQGAHTVVAKVTDGFGNVTEKTLTINLAKDNTPPQVTANASLYTAPEGWVEQQPYPVTASASDPNGYGVTSMTLKVDGAVVKSESQSCPDGGCGEALTGSLDMAKYAGGAHPAELIVADGAGNKSIKHWTVNVDPEGHVSAEEAADTVEAAEATGGLEPINPPEETPLEESSSGISLSEGADGSFETQGSNVPLTIAGESSEGMTMGVLSPAAFAVLCSVAEENVREGSEAQPCVTEGELKALEAMTGTGNGYQLEPVSIKPAGSGPGSAAAIPIGDTATVAANTGSELDTIIRPVYDGAMQFSAIRSADAPEAISWQVHLFPEQELKLLDASHAAVMYPDGQVSYTITATQARDAIGTSVPTSLTVGSNGVLTLWVHHRQPPPSGAYVYPIVAGAGWAGGFRTYISQLPPPMPLGPPEEETEEAEELVVSPPEPSTPKEAGEEDPAVASRASTSTTGRFFRWIRCEKYPEVFDPSGPWGPLPPVKRGGSINCGNPFSHEPPSDNVVYNFGVAGHFYVSPGNFVSHRGVSTNGIECHKQVFRKHFDFDDQYWFEPEFAIDPASRCLWWSAHPDGSGSIATPGGHITAYGQWTAREGEDGTLGNQKEVGSVMEIYSRNTRDGYEISRHKRLLP
jgi:streptogramin lyase